MKAKLNSYLPTSPTYLRLPLLWLFTAYHHCFNLSWDLTYARSMLRATLPFYNAHKLAHPGSPARMRSPALYFSSHWFLMDIVSLS